MLKWFAVLTFLFVDGTMAFAQVATAELTGSVLDSSGASIASAKVEAVDKSTNIVHRAMSDKSGVYRSDAFTAPALTP